MFDAWNVKYTMPRLSNAIVCGSFASGSGILKTVALPLAGSIQPIVAFLLPEYHGRPLASSCTVCGIASGGSAYSRIWLVFGSKRPMMFPYWPAYQIEPSEATMGSRVRCPSCFITYSLVVILKLPGTCFAGRLL